MKFKRSRAAAAADAADAASVPGSASGGSAGGAGRRRGARLRQQTLPSCVMTFAPRGVLSFYFAVSFLFIPFGAAVLAASAKVRRTAAASYGGLPACDVGPVYRASRRCTVPFEVRERIPAPSYLYYSLTEFHQNARKYAKSLSDQQLRGKVPASLLFVTNCEPMLYRANSSHGAKGFRPEEFLLPCGLTAWSRFNDTFNLCRDAACAQRVPLRKDGIAWAADRRKKFRPGLPPLYTDETNELLQDEDFMVWMRLATFKDFDKLYRIIDTDLEPGTYHMHINSQFPVASYNGDKLFYIATMTWFGSSNIFLGTMLVVTGLGALLVAGAMLARDVIKPRPPIAQNPDQLLVALARLNCEFSENSPRPHGGV
jgi:hypothetical protein